ncbi:hypothetical protein HBH74_242940 [Parastagonospora nodorum]|nr:hypothetical protein HBH74_242940 [Parastagonospora nodorum]
MLRTILISTYSSRRRLEIERLLSTLNASITSLTSKYTNRQNKLIDKVYKYIASYNKLSSFKRSNRKLLLIDLTSLKVSAY